MKKFLVYLAVFKNNEYIKLLNLFLISLAIENNKKEDINFDILILTSREFTEQLKAIAQKLNSLYNITIYPMEEKKDVFAASFAKYDIFQVDKIGDYEKLLYVDTDILIKGKLQDLFNENLESKQLACLREGMVGHESDYWGRSIFEHKKRSDLFSKDGFSAGVIYFHNNDITRHLFSTVIEHGHMYRQAGITFSTLDQPFLNYFATSADSVNTDFLEKYMVNNPENGNKAKLINHFPGGPGNHQSKMSKMSRFLFRLLLNHIPKERQNHFIYCLFNDGLAPGMFVKFTDEIGVAVLIGHEVGVVVIEQTSRSALFLDIPSFEVKALELAG